MNYYADQEYTASGSICSSPLTYILDSYREIIRQPVVHDCISDSIQVWSSMQWLSCLLTMQVPPFKQGLEAAHSLMSVRQL